MRPSPGIYPAGGRGTAIGYAPPQHATTAGARSSGPVSTPTSSGRPPRPAVTWPGTGPPRLEGGVVVLVGAFMALLDTTIVNVALPSVQDASCARARASLEWVVSGYARARADADPGRPDRRPVRPPPDVRRRADPVHAGQPGVRAGPEPGPARRRPGRAGPRRRRVLPGHRRDRSSCCTRDPPGARRSARSAR